MEGIFTILPGYSCCLPGHSHICTRLPNKRRHINLTGVLILFYSSTACTQLLLFYQDTETIGARKICVNYYYHYQLLLFYQDTETIGARTIYV
jgi:hypothetical protein